MNNQPDAVMEQTYENVPPPRPAEPTMRTATTAQRRDFFDDPRRKSPVLALVLSLMPGLGQIYVGYYQQGFTNALIVGSVIALLSSNMMRGAEPLFGIFLAFYWLFNVVDAWRRATFYNNALAGIGPATLPEEFAVTAGRGTLAGGVALVIVGVDRAVEHGVRPAARLDREVVAAGADRRRRVAHLPDVRGEEEGRRGGVGWDRSSRQYAVGSRQLRTHATHATA